MLRVGFASSYLFLHTLGFGFMGYLAKKVAMNKSLYFPGSFFFLYNSSRVQFCFTTALIFPLSYPISFLDNLNHYAKSEVRRKRYA